MDPQPNMQVTQTQPKKTFPRFFIFSLGAIAILYLITYFINSGDGSYNRVLMYISLILSYVINIFLLLIFIYSVIQSVSYLSNKLQKKQNQVQVQAANAVETVNKKNESFFRAVVGIYIFIIIYAIFVGLLELLAAKNPRASGFGFLGLYVGVLFPVGLPLSLIMILYMPYYIIKNKHQQFYKQKRSIFILLMAVIILIISGIPIYPVLAVFVSNMLH